MINMIMMKRAHDEEISLWEASGARKDVQYAVLPIS
jgi:hypothetical protein